MARSMPSSLRRRRSSRGEMRPKDASRARVKCPHDAGARRICPYRLPAASMRLDLPGRTGFATVASPAEASCEVRRQARPPCLRARQTTKSPRRAKCHNRGWSTVGGEPEACMPVPVFAEMGYLGRNGQVSPKIESVLIAESVNGKEQPNIRQLADVFCSGSPQTHTAAVAVFGPLSPVPPGAPGAGDPPWQKGVAAR